MRVRVMTMVAAAGVAAVCLTACSDGQSWSKYASEEDRFEAEFPGKVEKELLPLHAGPGKARILRSHLYRHMSDERLLMATVALYDAGTPNLSRGPEEGFRTYKCRTTTADKPLPYAKGTAREISGSECFGIGAEVESRWFQTDSWVHGAVAVVRPTLPAAHWRNASSTRSRSPCRSGGRPGYGGSWGRPMAGKARKCGWRIPSALCISPAHQAESFRLPTG